MCILYNSIDNNYKDYAYFKYDIAGVLGDVTDKYGNVSSYCMVEKSEDNVSFTRDQYYSNEYMLSQGYKVSGELEYIQNTYVVYSNAASGVLTAKTTVCKHATKVNTVTTKQQCRRLASSPQRVSHAAKAFDIQNIQGVYN